METAHGGGRDGSGGVAPSARRGGFSKILKENENRESLRENEN